MLRAFWSSPSCKHSSHALNTSGILVGIRVTSLSNATDLCSGTSTFRYQSIILFTWAKLFQYWSGQWRISNLDGTVIRHLWISSANFLVSNTFSVEALSCLYWNSKYLQHNRQDFCFTRINFAHSFTINFLNTKLFGELTFWLNFKMNQNIKYSIIYNI